MADSEFLDDLARMADDPAYSDAFLGNFVRSYRGALDRARTSTSNSARNAEQIADQIAPHGRVGEDIDSYQAVRWQAAHDAAALMAADDSAVVEVLREALEPFAFRNMGAEEDEGVAFTTQEVWETIHRDRVKDWISFEDIEAARAALARIDAITGASHEAK